MIAPTIVFALCFVASLLCAILLFRAHLRSRSRLLRWSAVSFLLFAANNAVAAYDVAIAPSGDVPEWRLGTALAAVVVLIYGFIWGVD